jgi:hypothetical protein
VPRRRSALKAAETARNQHKAHAPDDLNNDLHVDLILPFTAKSLN